MRSSGLSPVTSCVRSSGFSPATARRRGGCGGEHCEDVCAAGRGKPKAGAAPFCPFCRAGTPSTMSSPASTPSRRGSRRSRAIPVQTRKFSLESAPPHNATPSSFRLFWPFPAAAERQICVQGLGMLSPAWGGVRCHADSELLLCPAHPNVQRLSCERERAGRTFLLLPGTF